METWLIARHLLQIESVSQSFSRYLHALSNTAVIFGIRDHDYQQSSKSCISCRLFVTDLSTRKDISC